MHRESGFSLIELMVVVALATLMFGVALAYSVDWMARETMHAAAKDVEAFMQLAKIEAIARNRDCRFVVDPGSGTLTVWDAAGTPGDFSDDELLHARVLPRAVRFARPDRADRQITLADAGGGQFAATFASDGIVSLGDGAVHMQGGEQFGRVTVFVAGGVEIEYWNGSSWETGS